MNGNISAENNTTRTTADYCRQQSLIQSHHHLQAQQSQQSQQQLQQPQQQTQVFSQGTPYPNHQYSGQGHSLQRLLTSGTTAQQHQQQQAVPSPQSGGIMDKRVLSILRSSLEYKEARMTQLKNQLQQNAGRNALNRQHQQPPQLHHQSQQHQLQQHQMHQHQLQQQHQQQQNHPQQHHQQQHEQQQQPQVQPVQAVSEPTYKLHLPKAVDSVCLEPELDNSAACLAARIRTKAELKQVNHQLLF